MTNRFGTSDDMVIQHVVEEGVTYALAIDAKGLYLTTPDRLNTQLADPNRFAANRSAVEGRLAALGLDPAGLATDNSHRVRLTSDSASAKRVNPLKASKRAMKK